MRRVAALVALPRAYYTQCKSAYRTLVASDPNILYAMLLGMSVLALFAGYVIQEWMHLEHALSAHFFTELGIAGLIALFLAFTFEPIAQEEARRISHAQQKLLERDVFKQVFRRAVPKAITDEIVEQVLRATFIRDRMEMHYELTPIEGNSGRRFMRARLTLKYDITNITRKPQPFLLNTGIEPSPCEELRDEAKFLRLQVEGCQTPFAMGEQELGQIQATTPTRIRLDTEKLIVIDPQRTAHIELESQFVQHYERGYDYTIFNYHTHRLQIGVTAPPEEVMVHASAFADNYLKLDEGKSRPGEGVCHWTLMKPMLASQGVYVTWVPTPQPEFAAPDAEGRTEGKACEEAEPAPAEPAKPPSVLR